MVLLKGLYYIFLGIFLLKVLWNVGLAYALVSEMLKKRLDKSRGVSFMPIVEVIALVILIGLSALIESESLLFDLWTVLVSGSALIAASFVHFIVVAAIGGLIASRFFRGSGDQAES